MSKPYQMPSVAVGQTVQFFADDTAQADTEAAIVVAVGTRSIGLQVIGRETRTLRPMDGVRHTSDPDKQTIRMAQCGVWRHVPSREDLVLEELAREESQKPTPKK